MFQEPRADHQRGSPGVVGSESGLISGPESGNLSGHTRSRVLSGVSRVPLGSESGPEKTEKSGKKTREDPSRVAVGSVGFVGREELQLLCAIGRLSAPICAGELSRQLSSPLEPSMSEVDWTPRAVSLLGIEGRLSKTSCRGHGRQRVRVEVSHELGGANRETRADHHRA